MVFRTNRRRKSSAKRRYTKRRGVSHKRKVYRNKHRRKSYHIKRGGGFGTKSDCLINCETIKDKNSTGYNNCSNGCHNTFNPNNIQQYDVKIGNTEGDSYKANYMDADKY
jgi:hypothetical protein